MLKKENVEKKKNSIDAEEKTMKTDGNGLIKGIHNLVGNVY